MDAERDIKTLRGDLQSLRNDMDRRNRPLLLPQTARVMQVTTRILAASGLAWKKGQAIDGTLVKTDANTLTFTPGTAPPVDVWNMHEKNFNVGAQVLVLNVQGYPCAFDVDACGNYT